MSNVETVKSLLRICADGDHVYLTDYIKQNPSKRKYEIYDNHHWGPLHHAVASNSELCVKALLSIKSFDTEKRSFEGLTALYVAIKRDISVEIVQLLVDANPQLINIPDHENVYPMHVAILADKLNVVKALIETLKRKNLPLIDHTDLEGETSLMLAARNNNLEIVKYLMENTEFDCKRLSLMQLNAFTLATLYNASFDVVPGKEEETFKNTISILDLLLPPTYDYNPQSNDFPPTLLIPIILNHSARNYTILNWFIERFYLTDENLQRPLVARLLTEYKKDGPDSIVYSILFVLYSIIVREILEPPNKPCVSKLLWSYKYKEFYELFLSNRDLFDDIAKVVLPKFQAISFEKVDLAFFSFLKECIFHEEEKELEHLDEVLHLPRYDQNAFLEFLDVFPIHTNVEVQNMLTYRKCFHYCGEYGLNKNSVIRFMNEMCTLLIPFSAVNSKKDLIESIRASYPANRICFEDTHDIFKDVDNDENPPKLTDLCIGVVRTYVFRNDAGEKDTNQMKLNRLMSLDVSLRIKNLLRYNKMKYVLKN